MSLVERLHNEGAGPARQAAAVGLGVFIGCTPLFGLHLALSLATGWLLGLNRVLVYLASHVANPLVAPVIVATELQTGAWLRREAWLTPVAMGRLGIGEIAQDLLLGVVVVGGALAVTFGGLTYAVARRRALDLAAVSLIETTASRYLGAGITSWEFANGKLRLDPVYREILRSGVLPPRGTLVDLGCGAGLMLAILATSREMHASGRWPHGWPAPPDLVLRGVETRRRAAAIARQALGSDATIVEGDARDALPPCDAVLIFDVLHLMPERDQDVLIDRVAKALAPGGVLVLREADAGAGWRFRLVATHNWLTRAVQGRRDWSFHFRAAGDWKTRLERAGFDVEVEPMRGRTPFGNVALYARRRVH
jgi:uncharacterized protein (DUF2062 family)/2-polyprenyl-3-methyl-5-hydroxy-6-metoxy-1,4-benzoquinol methylase